jgi:hypothetical protein
MVALNAQPVVSLTAGNGHRETALWYGASVLDQTAPQNTGAQIREPPANNDGLLRILYWQTGMLPARLLLRRKAAGMSHVSTN